MREIGAGIRSNNPGDHFVQPEGYIRTIYKQSSRAAQLYWFKPGAARALLLDSFYSALFTFFSSAQIHNTLFVGISLIRAGTSPNGSINGLLFQHNSMTRPPYIQLAIGWEDVRCSVLPPLPLAISYGPAHDSWISFFLPGRSLKPLCLMKSCLSTFSFFPSSVLLERHLMEDSLRARYKNKFENENEWTRNRRDHVWFVFCP